jgi:hypothetical protein
MSNNGDELIDTGLLFDGPGTKHVIGIGNYHKTLPHNRFGEVDPDAYTSFRIVALTGGDYDTIARGPTGAPPNPVPFQSGYVGSVAPLVGDKFNNPQAARSGGDLSDSPKQFMMPPAPKVRSLSTAAEMTELQWMAIHRDVKFAQFTPAILAPAIADLNVQFNTAVAANEPGGLRLGIDLPLGDDGKLDLRAQTIFRCGLLGEDLGPLVSQFFIHDVAYGAQFIQQRVRPYAAGRDFLVDHGSWLRAQNAGFDEWGHGYSGDNDFATDPSLEEHLGVNPLPPRRISTMRDLARFVNKDALHQAYFNATLLCLSWGVPFDPGNPYLTLSRQAPFGSFGGPDLLTRVSEVASRALEVVWRQKWEVHRRLRPEVYGGLMQMQQVGLEETPGVFTKRAYGLPAAAFASEASQKLLGGVHHNYYLPIAFTAGSPPHPAYGAGHATVAGACVTVLKAWLDDKTPLQSFLTSKHPASPFANAPATDSPVVISSVDAGGELTPYAGADAASMTVEGELNKLACNVAMGRSMGGVHWRSDNTRSMRLGEQLAAEIMRRESKLYAERRGPARTAPFWSFTSFNRNDVVIFDGRVLVNGADIDPMSVTL